MDGELVELVDSSDYPRFEGADGITFCLGEAENAINQKLRDTSIEDLIRYDEGDRMAGAGI